jgi:tetratricopeptide (TPR) repeat protein
MGDKFLTYVTDLVNTTSWPEKPFANAKSQYIYEIGLDSVELFRGDPALLIEALRAFYQTDSRPYASAGIAAVLMSASYSHNDVYDESGLLEAQRWLEQAQAIIPDRLEINVLEPRLYIKLKRFHDARIILDYFQSENYEHYHIALTEMAYWIRQNNIEQAQHWYTQAEKLSSTRGRKICALNRLAECYFTNQHHKKAIETYEKLAKLDSNDPWLWHNMSIAYFRMGKYRESDKYNKKALSLMEFGAARNMEKLISKKKPSGWF